MQWRGRRGSSNIEDRRGMGTAGALARLGGLVAPSLMAVLATRDFDAMIGLFAALLVLAAVLSFGIGRETRGASIA